jgi:Lsr2
LALLLCQPRLFEKGTAVATKTNVVLIDDLDGSEAEESVKFALDGVTYEIDLSSKNAAKLRKELGSYVGSARRVGGRAVRGRAAKPARGSARKPETAEIRAWARDQGYDVSDRGRIPAEIIEAYSKGRR